MVEFGWLPLREALAAPNIKSLIADYYETLTPESVKAAAPCDPDWARMIELEEAGAFKCWCARDGEVLVGFITFQISYHLQFRQTLFALDAGHFIDAALCENPAWVYMAMWRSVEQPLRELGVRVIMAHDNQLQPMPAFFKRLGFEARAMNYSKVLKCAHI